MIERDRRWWRENGVAIEAHWLVLIMPLLRLGPTSTEELCEAAGVKSGSEYGHFLHMLERHRNTGHFIKAGRRHHRLSRWTLDVETAR